MKRKLKLKKYANGGEVDYEKAGDITSTLLSQTSPLVDNLFPTDQFGFQEEGAGGLKGAAQGASIGANPALAGATGGLSIATGALIGGGIGFFTQKDKNEKARQLKQRDIQLKQNMLMEKGSAIASQNDLRGINGAKFKYGGRLKKYLNGGTAEVLEGGQGIPLSSDAQMMSGNSHEQGGMPLMSNEGAIEVEDGETISDMPDNSQFVGSASIVNPTTGNLFSDDIAIEEIKKGKFEKKLNKIDSNDLHNGIDEAQFNIEKLASQQDAIKQQIEQEQQQTQQAQIMKLGGYLKKYALGDRIDPLKRRGDRGDMVNPYMMYNSKVFQDNLGKRKRDFFDPTVAQSKGLDIPQLQSKGFDFGMNDEMQAELMKSKIPSVEDYNSTLDSEKSPAQLYSSKKRGNPYPELQAVSGLLSSSALQLPGSPNLMGYISNRKINLTEAKNQVRDMDRDTSKYIMSNSSDSNSALARRLLSQQMSQSQLSQLGNQEAQMNEQNRLNTSQINQQADQYNSSVLNQNMMDRVGGINRKIGLNSDILQQYSANAQGRMRDKSGQEYNDQQINLMLSTMSPEQRAQFEGMYLNNQKPKENILNSLFGGNGTNDNGERTDFPIESLQSKGNSLNVQNTLGNKQIPKTDSLEDIMKKINRSNVLFKKRYGGRLVKRV